MVFDCRLFAVARILFHRRLLSVRLCLCVTGSELVMSCLCIILYYCSFVASRLWHSRSFVISWSPGNSFLTHTVLCYRFKNSSFCSRFTRSQSALKWRFAEVSMVVVALPPRQHQQIFPDESTCCTFVIPGMLQS